MSLPQGRILVTGAGSGIGAAIAVTLAEAGAQVAVNDIDADAAKRTAELVHDVGGTATVTAGDVASRAGAADVVQAAVDGLGGLTGLVNNVGLVRGGQLATVTEEDWDFVMRVDCSSALYCAQAALPHLGTGAAIVNLSSLCGIFPAPGAGSYNAAKAAVISLTQQMALEWGKLGIRANAIAPGLVSGTNFSASSKDRAAAERRKGAIPLGRTASARDIAPVAEFLLSDASRYMTGQVLVVDGGLGIGLQTLIPA